MSTNIQPGLRYTEDDEWIRVEGDEAYVGISDHAQDALSDIVFLELPDVGSVYGMGDVFGVVESVKAAADLMMPVGGEVVEVNEGLLDEPEKINTDPYDAWMVKIRMSDPAEAEELMDAAAYEQYCADRE